MDDRRAVIDRHAAESPIYVQIAADLWARRETFGLRVPSIVDISAGYGVARATAHHALGALVAWGHAELVTGKGYYWTPVPAEAWPLPKPTRRSIAA